MLCFFFFFGFILSCFVIFDRFTDVVDLCVIGFWEFVIENYNLRNGRKKYVLGDSCILYLNI